MAAVSPLGRASGVERRDAPADALTGLYERHGNRVFQYCLNWLRSREEAEDAAQTTFLYAYRGLDRGVVPMYERPWLLSIARKVCLSRTYAARRRSVEVTQDPHALEETIAAPAPSNELDGLTDALAALTEQQRHAILLREWHGLTYSEIAAQLDLSQAAVETLLFRARRSLARRLRQPLGVGSFFPWLRSLGEAGATKVALGAAAVAVTATTGAVTIGHQNHQPGQTVRTPAVRSAAAPRATPVARHAHPLPSKHHVATATATSPPAATPRGERPIEQSAVTPQAPAHTDSPGVSTPIAAKPPAVVQTIANTATTATTTASAPTDAAAPVVDTVTSATTTVANTVSSVVGNTTDAVASAAADVVSTAQAAIDAVTGVVPAIAGPKLP
jgi:RNA polymerase sigma-70 factor, ECF subfamily